MNYYATVKKIEIDLFIIVCGVLLIRKNNLQLHLYYFISMKTNTNNNSKSPKYMGLCLSIKKIMERYTSGKKPRWWLR